MRCGSFIIAALLLLAACDPEEPETLSIPAAAPAPEAETAFEWVVHYRRMMGLPLPLLHDALVASAQAHADYTLANQGGCHGDMSPHEEREGCPGFTGRWPWDRAQAAGLDISNISAGECMTYIGDGKLSVWGWLNSVYHSVCISGPSLQLLGYAKAANDVFAVDVLNFADGTTDPDVVTRWPPPNSRIVPWLFDGMEWPQPPVPPDGYPSGPIITLKFVDPPNVTGAALTLDGEDVPGQFLSSANDAQLGYGDYYFYAHRPLREERSYRVTFLGDRHGVAFEDSWTFFVPCAKPENGVRAVGCRDNELVLCGEDVTRRPCGELHCVESDDPLRERAVCAATIDGSCAAAHGTALRCSAAGGVVRCLNGFEVGTPCFTGHKYECATDDSGTPRCVEAPATACEVRTPSRCDGAVVVSCDRGFEQRVDCAPHECVEGARGAACAL